MKKLLIILAALSLSACMTTNFDVNGKATAAPKSTEMLIFFVSGIGQQQTVNAAEICGGANKVAKVETMLEPVDIIISMISFGIVTPQTAKVYCKA